MSRSIALHGRRWHVLPLPDSVESQQREQVLPDALAVVLETKLADAEDRDPPSLQPGVLAVVALAVDRQHVIALAVGLGHDPLIGPVEVKLPAVEVHVALGRRNPWVARQPFGEVTLK